MFESTFQIDLGEDVTLLREGAHRVAQQRDVFAQVDLEGGLEHGVSSGRVVGRIEPDSITSTIPLDPDRRMARVTGERLRLKVFLSHTQLYRIPPQRLP